MLYKSRYSLIGQATSKPPLPPRNITWHPLLARTWHITVWQFDIMSNTAIDRYAESETGIRDFQQQRKWTHDGFSSCSDFSVWRMTVKQIQRPAGAIDSLCCVHCPLWMSRCQPSRPPEHNRRLSWTPVQRWWTVWRSSRSTASCRDSSTTPVHASSKPDTTSLSFSILNFN